MDIVYCIYVVENELECMGMKDVNGHENERVFVYEIVGVCICVWECIVM